MGIDTGIHICHFSIFDPHRLLPDSDSFPVFPPPPPPPSTSLARPILLCGSNPPLFLIAQIIKNKNLSSSSSSSSLQGNDRYLFLLLFHEYDLRFYISCFSFVLCVVGEKGIWFILGELLITRYSCMLSFWWKKKKKKKKENFCICSSLKAHRLHDTICVCVFSSVCNNGNATKSALWLRY